MKNLSFLFDFIIITILFSGCTVVEGIFKAGFWSALLLVAVVVIGVIFVLAKVFKKKQ